MALFSLIILSILGYRISYAEWILQEIIPVGIKLHVMYDIACTLKTYLEVRYSKQMHIHRPVLNILYSSREMEEITCWREYSFLFQVFTHMVINSNVRLDIYHHISKRDSLILTLYVSADCIQSIAV